MKRNLFFMALSAMALVTSCSNDEVTEISDSDAIKYDLGIGKITRAADVYCNANKFKGFQVWANLGTAAYIAGDSITSTDGSTWTDASGTRYWPNTGNLDFYAVVNGGALNATTRALPAFTVAENVADQLDLCYAVKTGQTKGTTGTASSKSVSLNFRHALSQIVFKAWNKNANLYVEIDSVALYNVANSSTFTLPSVNTDDLIEDHPSSTSPTTIAGQGTWATPTGNTGYKVGFATKEVAYATTSVNLTDNTNASHSGTNVYGNAMLLMPQGPTTAWTASSGLTGVNGVGYTPNAPDGTFILVKCKIWNVSGDNVDKTNDVVLYENTNHTSRWAAIPASFTWQQGRKYIYTLIFDKGNGGIDPDPDDPKPVLVKIDYTVTVDDFVKGTDESVDMDKDITTSAQGGNSNNE